MRGPFVVASLASCIWPDGFGTRPEMGRFVNGRDVRERDVREREVREREGERDRKEKVSNCGVPEDQLSSLHSFQHSIET